MATTLTITDWIENGDETKVVYSDGQVWLLDETEGFLLDPRGQHYNFEYLREQPDIEAPSMDWLPEHVKVLLGQIGR